MCAKESFRKLFESGSIGRMKVENRIIMTAMLMRMGKDGYLTEQLKDYYAERARGGVGLLIVEATSIDWPVGRIAEEQLSVDDDRFTEGLSELAQLISGNGPKVALQLHHGGHVAIPVPGIQPVSASTIPRPGFPAPRELTVSEIRDIVVRFANGAERAKKAGFDGVEIHAGHTYLIVQFLSRAWNTRQDEYGGSLKNRARLLLETIEAVRERVGRDYPLWMKMNGMEYGVKDGITIEEAQQVAVMAQEAGIDAVHVTGHPCDYPMPHFFFAGAHPALPIWRPGHFLNLAERVKKSVAIPVIAIGRITPEIGEKALRQKKVDFIAIGRQLIADPELPKKIAQGKQEDVRPCVSCSSCLAPIAPKFREPGAPPKQCTVNPSFQREREYALKPAETVKKVLVVGGGPAGMEAARVAALRNHEVTLCERGTELGGLLPLATIFDPEKAKLDKYLRGQIKKLGVKIEYGREFTPEFIEEIKPDVLILAVGAAASLPAIPGIDGKNVISFATIEDILAKRTKPPKLSWRMGLAFLRFFGPSAAGRLLRFVSPFGKKIVILGSGLEAYELADFLVERGKKVTLVETQESFPSGMPPMPAMCEFFLDRLIYNFVPMLTDVTYERITDEGLVITDKHQWFRTIEADTIVVVGDRQPKKELLKELEGKVPEVHVIGDCAEPCGILEAIQAGFRIGRAI